MPLVRAIYANVVFRPLEPVELPDDCLVEFEPRLVMRAAMKNVYDVLQQRFASGETNVAERHNDHQS